MDFSKPTLTDPSRLRWLLQGIELDLWLPKGHPLTVLPDRVLPPKADAQAAKIKQKASPSQKRVPPPKPPRKQPSASPTGQVPPVESTLATPPDIHLLLVPTKRILWVFSQTDDLDAWPAFIVAASSFADQNRSSSYKPKPFDWPHPNSALDQSESVALEALVQVVKDLSQPESQLVIIGKEALAWVKKAMPGLTESIYFESASELMGKAEQKRRLWLSLTKVTS